MSNTNSAAITAKRFKLLPEMEGRMARWYARQRGSKSQLAQYREQADALAAELPRGADALEVAPGPGYFAIELARRGLRVTGLDVSHTMVDIATTRAREDGVHVDFRRGDVATMPFDDASFDCIVCQAAFKNFARPVASLGEMHRVLRPGGVAVIQDLDYDCSTHDIAQEVARQGARGFNAFITKWILVVLRSRAYTRATFDALARESVFGACTSTRDGRVTLEVRLVKL